LIDRITEKKSQPIPAILKIKDISGFGEAMLGKSSLRLKNILAMAVYTLVVMPIATLKKAMFLSMASVLRLAIRCFQAMLLRSMVK